jgi:DNA recombination protein RmuC
MTDETGRQYRPDVIILLPDNKHIVVDSKVSLTSYTEYIAEEDQNKKNELLKAHIVSVRNHIHALSQKNYQLLYQLNTLDFVIMFVPNEAGYLLAMKSDHALWNHAYERHIVLLGPANLIPALRLIHNLWKTEYQNRNAMEIARQSGELYDKFYGLISDLIEVGKKMDAAKENYEEAMKKISLGRGNLVKRVEELKKLGAKTSKALPQTLLERAEENE